MRQSTIEFYNEEFKEDLAKEEEGEQEFKKL